MLFVKEVCCGSDRRMTGKWREPGGGGDSKEFHLQLPHISVLLVWWEWSRGDRFKGHMKEETDGLATA